MCTFITKDSLPQVATKDIECWKFVEILGDKYYTPYRGTLIKIGKSYNSSIHVEYDLISIGLHSYILKEKLVERMKKFGWYKAGHKIVRCIIPKGSTYYVGGSHIPMNEELNIYVSNTIKYIEIVND